MKRAGRRGTTAGDPGWSNCVFCGTAVGKSARSREHIIPMWLLRASEDPHRKIKIESDPITGEDVVRPASTFHFPACEPCNQKYGKTLEKHAKKAIESLFSKASPALRPNTIHQARTSMYESDAAIRRSAKAQSIQKTGSNEFIDRNPSIPK